jgi:16S rRNA (uracil1498-N3)-methyltransferase
MSLKRLFCATLPLVGQSTQLSDEETLHALHVMRLERGATVLAIDGSGVEATATLETISKKAFIRVSEISRKEPKPAHAIVLRQAIIKADAMSWLIEKATELGCTDFHPTFTEYVAVRFKDREPAEIQARWQRVSDQALKQCGRLWKMNVHAPEKLSDALARQAASDSSLSSSPLRLWADETRPGSSPLAKILQEKKNGDRIEIAIGPEGGWGPSDRGLLEASSSSQWQAVGLGPHILRSETAALYALSLCQGLT